MKKLRDYNKFIAFLLDHPYQYMLFFEKPARDSSIEMNLNGIAARVKCMACCVYVFVSVWHIFPTLIRALAVLSLLAGPPHKAPSGSNIPPAGPLYH